jgi:hypothetical protein
VIMQTQTSKLKDRLGLLPQWSKPEVWLQSLDINKQPFYPGASDTERAGRKDSVCDKRSLLALACYFDEQPEQARVRGKEFITESEEFFFGEWRNTFITPEGQRDPTWWKRKFGWIDTFEAALLWGSVLGEWDYLKRVGGFPEADSTPGFDCKPQERDLYVAIGALISGASASDLSSKLDKAATGSRKSCKLLVGVARACITRDSVIVNKCLKEYLRHYKKNEFPQKDITKMISMLGTFFVHWVEKEGLPVGVPPEFADHIVRLAAEE